MRTAYSLIRNGPHYMPEVWRQGLAAAGYRVKTTISKPPRAGDVLLIWNRYGSFDCVARQFEKAGATVLVAENGYYGRDDSGHRLYALSIGQHHHGGSKKKWRTDTKNGLCTPLNLNSPYKTDGKIILVCEQRGIGSPLMRSPPEWAEKTAAKLQALGHKTRIRRHPGKYEPAMPLVDDLADVKLCAVWSSACGVEALVNSVQVVYDSPRFIAEASASRLMDYVLSGGDLPRKCRNQGLIHMASNQWTISQIRSGEPFMALGCYGE